jgi:hypothetical protein
MAYPKAARLATFQRREMGFCRGTSICRSRFSEVEGGECARSWAPKLSRRNKKTASSASPVRELSRGSRKAFPEAGSTWVRAKQGWCQEAIPGISSEAARKNSAPFENGKAAPEDDRVRSVASVKRKRSGRATVFAEPKTGARDLS